MRISQNLTGEALVFSRGALLWLGIRPSARPWKTYPPWRTPPHQVGGGRRQRTVDARIGAEDILKSQQREETPAHWQLAEWSIGANGMPDLVGAAPARFVEPQSQHGAHGGRMIERRPKRRKRLFELLLLDRLGIDPFRDPLLDGQHRPREGRIFSRTTLPSPIGQDQFAMVADWPSASLAQAKGN